MPLAQGELRLEPQAHISFWSPALKALPLPNNLKRLSLHFGKTWEERRRLPEESKGRFSGSIGITRLSWLQFEARDVLTPETIPPNLGVTPHTLPISSLSQGGLELESQCLDVMTRLCTHWVFPCQATFLPQDHIK